MADEDATHDADAENADSGSSYDTRLSMEEILSGRNLADLLADTELARIGHDVIRHIEIDEQSRADWIALLDDGLDLAMQVAEVKSYPFDRASNVIYPLITTAALQFAQRAYPAVVPGNRIVQCAVIGKDDGLYEVQQDPQTGGPVMDESGKPASRMVTPPGVKADRAERVSRHMSWQVLFNVPEWETGLDQLLHYLPIAGCAFRKVFYRPDKRRPAVIWIPADRFIINNAAKSIESAPRFAEKYTIYPFEIRRKVSSGEFLDVPVSDVLPEAGTEYGDDEAPRIFFEAYVRLDLDGDENPEPYIVTLHESGKIFRIDPNFAEANADGTFDPLVSYVKYSFLPNPRGDFYDMGFGWLLAPINKAVNTAINQLFDAGHWQNAPAGFIGRGIRLGRAGRIELTPNSLKPVDSTGEELSKNIWIYEHQGPSQTLFQLLGMMIRAGQDISSVQDILQGRTDFNLAPTTASALVEQGLQTFTSIFKRIHRSLKEEFGLIYALNARTLPQHMYAYSDVLDDPQAISGQDYQEKDMDVRPVTDPKMVSDQVRQLKAQFLNQLADAGLINRREAVKRMLDAFHIDDIESLLPDEGADQAAQKEAMEVAQLQKTKLGLEIQELQATIASMATRDRNSGIELAAKVDKTRNEILGIRAGAIVDLAEAEAKEAGSQLDAYIATADRLAEESSAT